jgi:hypothetical protein
VQPHSYRQGLPVGLITIYIRVELEFRRLYKIEETVKEIKGKWKKVDVILAGIGLIQAGLDQQVYKRHQQKDKGLGIVFNADDLHNETRVIEQYFGIEDDADNQEQAEKKMGGFVPVAFVEVEVNEKNTLGNAQKHEKGEDVEPGFKTHGGDFG